jgi:hypothetical protein
MPSTPSVADLMVTDRHEVARTVAVYVIGTVIMTMIMYSPVIVLISIGQGNANTEREYIPRGSSLMWKYSCAQSDVIIHGDILRIAAKAEESNASNYDSSKYFCYLNNTSELCVLSRATFRCGTTKWVADILFLATVITTTVVMTIFLRKAHTATIVVSATFMAASAIIGIAAMSAQVAAIRAFTQSDARCTSRASFTASFGAIFAASGVEILLTIVYVGAYIVFRRRASCA